MSLDRREILKLGIWAAAVPRLPALAQTAGWRPEVFDPHQNDTAIVLSDLIIPVTDTPGAKAALVNRYMDLLLRDGQDADRVAFLSGLAWIDALARRRNGKPFIESTQPQQIELLHALDTDPSPDLAAGAAFFRSFKSLTARIYYATEIGFQEINRGGRVPATYGCNHPEHAV